MYIALVAPLIAFQVFPSSSLRDQVNVGGGFPLAATVKVALLPDLMFKAAGCAVMLGATSAGPTVTVAGAVTSVPAELVTVSV